MNRRYSALLLLAGLSTLNCDDSSSPVSASETEPADSDTIVYDTIVFQAADGSLQSRDEPITLRDRRAQEAARAARGTATTGDLGTRSQAVISQSSSCDAQGLWLYDGLDQTGRRLCLVNQTPSPHLYDGLDAFCYTLVQLPCFPAPTCPQRCTQTWAGHVKSYWPGAKAGGILNTMGYAGSAPYSAETFDSYGPRANLPSTSLSNGVELRCGNAGFGSDNSLCPG